MWSTVRENPYGDVHPTSADHGLLLKNTSQHLRMIDEDAEKGKFTRIN